MSDSRSSQRENIETQIEIYAITSIFRYLQAGTVPTEVSVLMQKTLFWIALLWTAHLAYFDNFFYIL